MEFLTPQKNGMRESLLEHQDSNFITIGPDFLFPESDDEFSWTTTSLSDNSAFSIPFLTWESNLKSVGFYWIIRFYVCLRSIRFRNNVTFHWFKLPQEYALIAEYSPYSGCSTLLLHSNFKVKWVIAWSEFLCFSAFEIYLVAPFNLLELITNSKFP